MPVSRENETVTIRSEDEAWARLREALDSDIHANHALTFQDWPQIGIHLSGPKFQSSLTSSTMSALLDIQRSVNKAYSILKYDDDVGHHLTEEERAKLELVVRVEEGSSAADIDLTDIAKAIVEAVVGRMDPTQVMIAVIACSLLIAGKLSFKTWVDYKRDVRIRELENQDSAANRRVRIEELQTLARTSEQDTERLRMLTEAINVVPALATIERVSRDSMHALVRIAARSNTATVQGMELSGGQASELKLASRNSRVSETITGRFTVKNVDSSNGEYHRVTFEAAVDGAQLKVDVPRDTASERTRQLIQEAEWGGFEIDAEIEVELIAGRTEGRSILAAERVQSN